jgi:hypothetical protein
MEDKRKKLLGKLSKLVKTQAQTRPSLPTPPPFRPYNPMSPVTPNKECRWADTPFGYCQLVFPDVFPFGCRGDKEPRDRRPFPAYPPCKDADGNPIRGVSNCPVSPTETPCNRFPDCQMCDENGNPVPNCKSPAIGAPGCFGGPEGWEDPPMPPVPPDSPFYIDPPVPGGPPVPTFACLCFLVKKNNDGSYMVSDEELKRKYCPMFGSYKPCEYKVDENGRPILDDDGRAQYVDPNCIPVTCPHVKNTQNDNPLNHGHISCRDVGSGDPLRDPLMLPGQNPTDVNSQRFIKCIQEYCRRFPNCTAPIRLPNTPGGGLPPSRWRGWTTVMRTNPCLAEIQERIRSVCADITNVKPDVKTDDNPLIDSQPEKDPSDRINFEDQLP